jgi:hypothetical protein
MVEGTSSMKPPHRSRLRSLAVALLLLLFAPLADAGVFYVSQWRARAPMGGIPLEITSLEFLGVVALATPSLQEVGRWRDLPPAMNILASADERWLFLWNDQRLEGGLVDDARMHVVDRTAMRLVASWPMPAAASSCTRPRFDTAIQALAHPRRSRVIVFRGVCWFDTEIGAWVATPESIGMPAGWSPDSIFLLRVSDDGRFASFWRPTPATAAIVDLDAATLRGVSATPLPGVAVAFSGEAVIRVVGLLGGNWSYGVFDRATGVQRGQFSLPYPAGDMVAHPRWGLVIGSNNRPVQFQRLAAPDGQPVPFNTQPLPADAALRLLVADDGLLTGFSSDPGCGLIGCLLGQHALDFVDAAGIPRGSLRSADAVQVGGLQQVVSYTANGDSLVRQPAFVATVPSGSRGATVAVVVLFGLFAACSVRTAGRKRAQSRR